MILSFPRNRSSRRSGRVKFIDSLYLGLLIGYVLAGCVLVPFHGDESTTLYESRDFSTFFLHGDLTHLIYRIPPPADDPESATRQDLRILNGVLSGDIYGVVYHLAGFATADLNQQWIWGAEWSYNQSQNAFPKPTLLFVARWTSALLTVLSVALIFAAGYRIGGRWTAWLAAAIYALTPMVLLNGRRAVFEGSLLFTEALLLYVTLRVIDKRPSIKSILALGAASGLAILSKHTNALVIAAAFAGIILYPIIRAQWRKALATVGIIFAAGLIAGAIFLAFNPAWWGNPLGMPKIVLDRRQALIGDQSDPTTSPLSLINTNQRIATLIRESLSASPQYFENGPIWQQWIGDQIARYQASGLAGLSGNLWSAILAILLVFGLLVSTRTWQNPRTFALLIWIGVVAVSLYVLNPVDWQRYYLPMAAPIALIAGQVIHFDRRLFRRTRSIAAQKSALPSASRI